MIKLKDNSLENKSAENIKRQKKNTVNDKGGGGGERWIQSVNIK